MTALGQRIRQLEEELEVDSLDDLNQIGAPSIGQTPPAASPTENVKLAM